MLTTRQIFIAGLMLGLPPASFALPTEAEIEQKNQDMATLRSKIDALQRELAEQNDTATKEQRQLRKLDTKISQVASKLRESSAALTASSTKVSELQAQQTRLHEDLTKRRQTLRESLAASYALSQQPDIKLLLSQDDLSSVSRLMAYQQYLTSAQQQAIAQLKTDSDQLTALAQQAQEQQAQIVSLKATLEQQQAELQAQRDERKKSLALIQKKQQNHEQQLGEWRKNERDLQRLLTDIQQVLEQTRRREEEARRIPDAARGRMAPPFSPVNGAFAKTRGQLSWPVSGAFLAQYGQRRAGGNAQWRGVFIGAPEGTDVRAVAEGRVVFADWLRGFGNLLIVDHGGGYMSLYGYNDQLVKTAGENVRSGDVIGAAGISGGQAQSGVYFELRHNGEPIDPSDWCRR